MVLHKQVNGIRIQLSAEEEARVRAEWAKNDFIAEKQREVHELVKQHPSVEERLMAVENCLYKMLSTKELAPHVEGIAVIEKCMKLKPMIEKAKEAVKAEEAK